MSSAEETRAHLDRYAAVLRDLREDSDTGRPDYATLPSGMDPKQTEAILDRIAALAADVRSSMLIATIAGTLAMHLPFVPVEHVGAVLLDLSEFMIGFVAHPDAEAAAFAAADLPLLVALVGQEMYSGGAA